jgi:ribosomal protein S18/ribosomal protein S6
MNEKYELYFILTPGVSSDKVDSTVEDISALLKKELNAENISTNLEGVKKLAYPIKKYRTGYYVLIEFECPQKPETISGVEKKLNINDSIIRYILVNQTEYYQTKENEIKSNEPEFTHHRELNKGKKSKQDIIKYLGIKAIDYKDSQLLNQFTSPYAKIFTKDRTGLTAKNQRKIKRAIKRARHMALMPFTPKHFE